MNFVAFGLQLIMDYGWKRATLSFGFHRGPRTPYRKSSCVPPQVWYVWVPCFLSCNGFSTDLGGKKMV